MHSTYILYHGSRIETVEKTVTYVIHLMTKVTSVLTLTVNYNIHDFSQIHQILLGLYL
jgi:hypothetical protein